MNLLEVANKFPDELACIQHAEELRWGKKPVCPKCNQHDRISKRQPDYRFKCFRCDSSFSVTSGSRLHNFRLPIRTWFFALSVFTDGKKGVSALQMQRHIGVSYPTCHRMLMAMREMMDDLEQGKVLDGIVEMDETFVGGKPRKPARLDLTYGEMKGYDRRILNARSEKGLVINRKRKTTPKYPDLNVKRGRGTKKTPVVGMVSRDGDVIVQVMQKLTYKELKAMVKKHVDMSDSVLITDSYKGYARMSNIIDHIMIDHQKAWSYRGIDTNTIEGFWASIKRSIIGTYHQVSVKHLPSYVVEIAFKYNNRHDNDAMFDLLVKHAFSPHGQ